MASTTFRCQLITPAASVLDENVTYASVPAWDGLFGVLPGRAPMVAKLGLGELQLRFPDKGSAKGGSRSFLIEDGFVQMVDNKLTILASRAFPTESIAASDAKAELAAAESKKPTGTGEALARAQAIIEADKARARMKVRLASGSKGI
jgi:F-type H+-transporting ATPase subunit epsilon